MSQLIKHVENCLNKTDNYNSKITPDIYKIGGMSGKKQDIFIIIYVLWIMPNI
jgi:hypothetical protein